MYEFHAKLMELGVGGREIPLFVFGGPVRTIAGLDIRLPVKNAAIKSIQERAERCTCGRR